MLASIRFPALGLFINILTLAAHVQPMVGRRDPLSPSITLGTASGGALDPLATHPPAFGPKAAFAGGSDLTINVVNSFGGPLSIFYGSNVGAPTPVNNPGPGTLSSSTQVLFPSGWAGRITIGGNYDPKGSKIEASYSSPDYVPDVDISYVDGYSVPITCSCAGVAVTGCNVELFNDGQTCPSLGPGPICYNPEENVPNGPAASFFAPCAGAAYTYPNGTFVVSQEATYRHTIERHMLQVLQPWFLPSVRDADLEEIEQTMQPIQTANVTMVLSTAALGRSVQRQLDSWERDDLVVVRKA